MPFDGTDFDPRPEPPRKRSDMDERIICALIVAIALALLVLPISAASLTDIARYLLRK